MAKTSKAQDSDGATRAAAAANKSTRNSQSVESKFRELKRRLLEISDLNAVGAVLGWGQATYMPPGRAGARARHSAILSRRSASCSTGLSPMPLTYRMTPVKRASYASQDATSRSVEAERPAAARGKATALIPITWVANHLPPAGASMPRRLSSRHASKLGKQVAKSLSPSVALARRACFAEKPGQSRLGCTLR